MAYHSARAAQWRALGDVQILLDARRQQLAFAEGLAAREPASAARQRELALASKYYGAVEQDAGSREIARRQYERALAIDRKALDAEPENPNRKLDLSFTHASVGSLRRDEGDFEGALEAYGLALVLRQQVFTTDSDNEFAFRSLVRGHQSIADVFARRGDLARAVREDEAVLRLRENWEERHPSAHGARSLLAGHRESTGDRLGTVAAAPATPAAERRAYWRRAKEEYASALAIWTAIAGDTPPDAEIAGRTRQLREALGRCDAALE